MNTETDSKGTSRPLYLYPKGADLEAVKAAVLELDLPFRVAPYWFKEGEHDKCVVLDDGFPWLVDHVYPKSHNSIKASVEWFFGMRDLPQVKTTLSKLESVFGEVREVFPEWPPSE